MSQMGGKRTLALVGLERMEAGRSSWSSLSNPLAQTGIEGGNRTGIDAIAVEAPDAGTTVELVAPSHFVGEASDRLTADAQSKQPHSAKILLRHADHVPVRHVELGNRPKHCVALRVRQRPIELKGRKVRLHLVLVAVRFGQVVDLIVDRRQPAATGRVDRREIALRRRFPVGVRQPLASWHMIDFPQSRRGRLP